MSGYAIFFDYNNKTYRLPVNPAELEVSSVQANEKYEVLKLGQIVVPVYMELQEYSFETELPGHSSKSYRPSYIETPNEIRDAAYYLKHFESWRNKLVPVRFIAGKITEDNDGDIEMDDGEVDLDKSINTLVLIEELTITEKAGEEGDKYVKFKLIEYRQYEQQKANELVEVSSSNYIKKKTASANKVNPKSNGAYTVQSGDSLWSIAKKYYGDGGKCNIIYNANKDKIKNPALIQIGWKLKIPSKDEFSKYNAALPSSGRSSGYNAAGFRGGISAGGSTHSTSRGEF